MSNSDPQLPLLSLRGLSKGFGATRALVDVDLELHAGEVHGLVGQNGSGKSTLIKILSGYYTADEGAARLRGETLALPLPVRELRRRGISFMHQDLGLVESMSVLENLAVGRFETGFGRRIRWPDMRARTRALLRRFDLDVDPAAPVGKLSPVERAVIGVMRALNDVEQAGPGGLLVLDEPTASLSQHEVEVLFNAMRRVTESGSTVLFVSHSLDEVLSVCDRISVLRDGRLIDTVTTDEIDQARLINLILGRDLEQLYPRHSQRSVATIVMEVRGLCGRLARDVSLDLHEGETLGLTGLVGAGHDEVPYLIYGAREPRAGSIVLGGRATGKPSPDRSRRAGVALLPADRQRQAGIPRASVRENVTLPELATFRRRLRIESKRERSAAAQVLQRLSVHPPEPERRLMTLSGGNQQKVLLGRWLRLQPRVLLLHEPTQGVDVGARAGILEILRDSSETGTTSIIYASVEHEDLANLCDRVLVFRKGRIVSELSGVELSGQRLAQHCYQGRPAGGRA